MNFEQKTKNSNHMLINMLNKYINMYLCEN